MEKAYVSPHYAETLDHLAHTLVTARRFGDAALQDTVEFPAVTDQLALDIPDSVVLGQE